MRICLARTYGRGNLASSVRHDVCFAIRVVPISNCIRRHALALLFAALSGSGCYARTQGYVVAEAPPAYIDTYPTYYYEGRTVYLVDGRWYTRNHGHWVYYRSEPPELYRYRTTVRVAPPARYERREYRRGAPPAYYRREAPAYRREPAPAFAPPASRRDAPPASHRRVPRPPPRDREH